MQITSREELEHFAKEAQHFLSWARGENGALMTITEALRRILRLYLAGLDLPQPHVDKPDTDPPAVAIAPEVRDQVMKRTSLLPFQYYRCADEPILEHQSEEKTLVGWIADDIADIYCDVCKGQLLFDRGSYDEARWEWGWGLENHWGRHATLAIMALHAHYEFER